MRFTRLIACVAVLWFSGCAPWGGGVQISEAQYRAPLGSSDIGAAYFSIRSAKPDAIVSVSSIAAAGVEMHATVNEGGMSRMVRIDRVDLPAGETVSFSPGGMHLMVFSPAPIEAGATLPITIGLESGATLQTLFGASVAGR